MFGLVGLLSVWTLIELMTLTNMGDASLDEHARNRCIDSSGFGCSNVLRVGSSTIQRLTMPSEMR